MRRRTQEDRDAKDFHAAMRAACEGQPSADYPALQGLVRRLFLSAAPERDARHRRHLLRLSQTPAIGRRISPSRKPSGANSCGIYPEIVRRNMLTPWTEEGSRGAARPPRPLCRVQPALRSRHPLRAEDRRQCRGDPVLDAAARDVALGFLSCPRKRASSNPRRGNVYWIARSSRAMTTRDDSPRYPLTPA